MDWGDVIGHEDWETGSATQGGTKEVPA
jgi:hypothetical protein